MKDRNVEFSQRYRLQKVEGTDDIYDLLPAPGEVFEEGTPINKATLLKDATAALFGLDGDAVPDDVFGVLSEAALAKIVSVPDKVAGVDWESTAAPENVEWMAIAYGNGRFVAVSANGQKIVYSDDGINWTETTQPLAIGHLDVCYGGGRFVATCSNTNAAVYSDDGINWTKAELPLADSWVSVAYGNGRFVMFADASQYFVYSDDGIEWQQGNFGSEQVFYKVAYGGGKFVTIHGTQAKAFYSENGTTWASTQLSGTYGSYHAIAYGGGIFVALPYASNGGPSIYYSTDGITWTATTEGINGAWLDVVYGDGKFVAVAYDTGGGTTCAYSEDGITWVENEGLGTGPWQEVAYGDGKFVAVSPYAGGFAISQNTYLDNASFVDPLGNLVPIPGDQVVGGVKIATGSYTGTGTYGSSNPNSLTFDFVPKLVMIYRYVDNTGASRYTNATFSPDVINTSTKYYSVDVASGQQEWYGVAWNGNTVSWHSTASAMYQLNNSAYTYYYIAIG